MTDAFGPSMRKVDTVNDQEKPSIRQAARFEGYSRREGYSTDDSRELVYGQNSNLKLFKAYLFVLIISTTTKIQLYKNFTEQNPF